MLRRILGVGLAGLLLLAMVPAARAEKTVRLEVDFFGPAGGVPINHATVWLSKRRLRIEQRQAGLRVGGPALIYRGDQDRFISVDSRSRTYAMVDRDLLTSVGKQIQAARIEVSQQLGALPSDQRAAFERLLGVSASAPDVSREPVLVTAEGVIEEVGGLECSRVRLERDEQTVGRACVTPWQDVGMDRIDMDVLRQLGNFQRELMGARGLTPMELVPNQPLDLLVQFGGFPLYFERITRRGTSSSIRVVEVAHEEAARSVFEPPASYELRAGFQSFAGPLEDLIRSTPPARAVKP